MIEDFENKEVRSSGDLWSQICSSLPAGAPVGEPIQDVNGSHFTDSFQPASQVGTQANGQSNDKWEPMDDSEIYIASLENRLKRLKGQSSDITSRDMLRSLSQAKKECWDRFLHDEQTSELFQGGDMDESAVEHFKRWLIPEKVAISAEELEYLLRPSQNSEAADGTSEQADTQDGTNTEGETQTPEQDDAHSPEK